MGPLLADAFFVYPNPDKEAVHMTRIMKAREAAEQVYVEVREQVAIRKARGIDPQLAVILIEGDPASAYYARAKQRIAARLGITYTLYSLPQDLSEDELVQLIMQLNEDHSVHGIMLELPLPEHLSVSKVTSAISPVKDIDGVTPSNRLAVVTGDVGLYPATPQACINLLKYYGCTLRSRNVTLIGRGQTVGLPLFHMLQRENATVTVCHSHTSDLSYHIAHADIVFTAVGRAGIVTPDMVHDGLVVVDAGINETASGEIVGDVSSEVIGHVAALSPVPGGVGTLTTACLFANLMQAVRYQLEKERIG